MFDIMKSFFEYLTMATKILDEIRMHFECTFHNDQRNHLFQFDRDNMAISTRLYVGMGSLYLM